MKKVLTLFVTGLMFLVFAGCDTGSVGSDPINPTVPVETLAVGSLTLTLDDPAYEDGTIREAVVTAASENGATFSETVPLDSSSVVVTVKNLLAGDWNIKVKVREEGMVTAVAFETAVIANGLESVISPKLYTKEDLGSFLNEVYEEYNISGKEALCSSLTRVYYELLANDEEIAKSVLSVIDDSNTNEILKYVTYLFDQTSFFDLIEELLSSTISQDLSLLDGLNTLWGGEPRAMDYYLSFFSSISNKINQAIIGDYVPLYYDLIDVTIDIPESFTPNGTLPDADTLTFSASSAYDSLTGVGYVWYLNGKQVGTGSSYDMATADCVADLNYLSVQFVLSADGTSVILGSESVVFYSEGSVLEIIKVLGDTDFANYLVAKGYDTMDSLVGMTRLELILGEDTDGKNIYDFADDGVFDITGIEYLTNLDELTIFKSNLTGYSSLIDSDGATLKNLSEININLNEDSRGDLNDDLIDSIKTNYSYVNNITITIE